MTTTPDPHAPDPRASQRVAAMHRARQSMPTTDLRPTPPITNQHLIVFGAGLLVLLACLIALANSSSHQLESEVPIATPATLATVTPATLATAIPPVTKIDAFGAPDSNRLGQIEITRIMTPTGDVRIGWIQADVQGSGLVWLRRSDVPKLASTIPEIAPVTASATLQPAAKPTAVAPCETAGLGDKVVTVCGWEGSDALKAEAQRQWSARYLQATPTDAPTRTAEPNFYATPPNYPIDEAQKLIGSDPNAPACQNAAGTPSPICGGMTNRQAQAALDARRATAAAATATP